MRSFLLASLCTLLAVPNANAHPRPHGPYSLSRRAVDLDSFRVKVATTYKNATAVEADPSIPSLSKRAEAQDIATELVKTTVPDATFRLVDDHYVGNNGVAHFYFKQTANGLDIDTADFNVNVRRNPTNVFEKRQDATNPLLETFINAGRSVATAQSSPSVTRSIKGRYPHPHH